MNMDGKGAYILSGIKIFPKEEDDLHAQEKYQLRKWPKSRVLSNLPQDNSVNDAESHQKRQRTV